MVDSKVVHGDCLAAMRGMADACVDSIVTDPPYELGFMGKSWDASGIANSVEMWREAYRVLKPGGHLLAFSGSRTYHRMVCAIEDAGFEIRDQIFWVYGSGFPKSLNVSVAIDKAAGAEREVVGDNPCRKGRRPEGWSDGWDRPWQSDPDSAAHKLTAPATPEAQQWAGWGTALKPAHEPIVVARKPLIGTVAQNVLAHGTGALNIDACRVATTENLNGGACSGSLRQRDEYSSADSAPGAVALSRPNRGAGEYEQPAGRWPANCIHDGSDEVLEAFAAFGQGKSSGSRRAGGRRGSAHTFAQDEYTQAYERTEYRGVADAGTAARFFYSAKAGKSDRAGSKHPTVKPISLMRYLVKLVTPPGGTVLDPFAGSGTTLQAAVEEGFHAIGIEQSEEYANDIRRRLARAGKAAEKPAPRPKAVRAARRKAPDPGAWPNLLDMMTAP